MAFAYTQDIRADLAEAHRKLWGLIAAPGNWWRGAERVAIAAEVRNARQCGYCAQRKAALSPYGVQGTHDTSTNLPPAVVDAVHRITTDPSRLAKAWLDELAAQGVSDAHYAEMLGVIVATVSVDAFHRAMGIALEPLPEAQPGEPARYRPPGAKDHGAWLPSVAPKDVSEREADMYGGARATGNVISAMSLAPDAIRMLDVGGTAQYLAPHQVADPEDNGGRALTRPQIELLAGRVSAMSNCFY